MSNITVDIGDLCTHCFQDTSFSAGNGKFVNRIPSGSDAEITSVNTENTIFIGINGYMCTECRLIECDKCDTLSLEPEIIPHPETGEGMVICENCYEKEQEDEQEGED